MRSSAPYTRTTLRGSRCGRGHNSTSASPSRVVTTNTKHLHSRRPPSLQPADIPFADILSASQTKTLKEEKVDIVKDLLQKWGWSF